MNEQELENQSIDVNGRMTYAEFYIYCKYNTMLLEDYNYFSDWTLQPSQSAESDSNLDTKE